MTFQLLVVVPVVSILKLSNQGAGQQEGSHSKSSAIMDNLNVYESVLIALCCGLICVMSLSMPSRFAECAQWRKLWLNQPTANVVVKFSESQPLKLFKSLIIPQIVDLRDLIARWHRMSSITGCSNIVMGMMTSTFLFSKALVKRFNYCYHVLHVVYSQPDYCISSASVPQSYTVVRKQIKTNQ